MNISHELAQLQEEIKVVNQRALGHMEDGDDPEQLRTELLSLATPAISRAIHRELINVSQSTRMKPIFVLSESASELLADAIAAAA